MSMHEVVRFVDQAHRDGRLAQALRGAEPTARAWVALAEGAGFTFTVDELRAVAEETLERRLDGEGFVTELLSPPEGELSDAEVVGVAGGVGQAFEVPLFRRGFEVPLFRRGLVDPRVTRPAGPSDPRSQNS